MPHTTVNTISDNNCLYRSESNTQAALSCMEKAVPGSLFNKAVKAGC